MPIPDPIHYAERFWSIKLKRSHADEWVGPCPKCSGGDDRFHVWEEKQNYWCRVCGHSGFLDSLEGQTTITWEQRVDLRLAELERQNREAQKQIDALAFMERCTDHLRYHDLLDLDRMTYWLDEGINVDSIAKYKLGWCPRCPTDKEGRPSYTIPIINGGKLVNIRHRLIGGIGGDKYRPHCAGLGLQLFNADYADQPGQRILICEGEKKSIVCAQEGFPNVAVMGQNSFKREWIEKLARFPKVYVVLDPGAEESAHRLARVFDGRGYVVALPVKADDFFARFSGTRNDFESFIGYAKPVQAKTH